MTIETIKKRLDDLECKVRGCGTGGELHQLMNQIEQAERNLDRIIKITKTNDR